MQKESGNAMELHFRQNEMELKWSLNGGPNFTPKNVMEVKPPLTLYFVPLDNPPVLTLLLLPTTTTMSSTLSHSMEDDLIDNAFLAMMLPLLKESQKVSKPRQRGGAAETARPTRLQPR